jgi:hypothetical protein
MSQLIQNQGRNLDVWDPDLTVGAQRKPAGLSAGGSRPASTAFGSSRFPASYTSNDVERSNPAYVLLTLTVSLMACGRVIRSDTPSAQWLGVNDVHRGPQNYEICRSSQLLSHCSQDSAPAQLAGATEDSCRLLVADTGAPNLCSDSASAICFYCYSRLCVHHDNRTMHTPDNRTYQVRGW